MRRLKSSAMAVLLCAGVSSHAFAVDYEQSIQCAGFFEFAQSMQADASEAIKLKEAWSDYAQSIAPDANVSADVTQHAAMFRSDMMAMQGDPAKMGPYMEPYQQICPNPLRPVMRPEPGLCAALAQRASMTVMLNVVAKGDPMKRGGFTQEDLDNLAESKRVRAVTDLVEARYKDVDVTHEDVLSAQETIPEFSIPDEAMEILEACNKP